MNVPREVWHSWSDEMRSEWESWFNRKGYKLTEIQGFDVGESTVELSLIHGPGAHLSQNCPDGTARRLLIPANWLCQFETLLIETFDHPDVPG